MNNLAIFDTKASRWYTYMVNCQIQRATLTCLDLGITKRLKGELIDYVVDNNNHFVCLQ